MKKATVFAVAGVITCVAHSVSAIPLTDEFELITNVGVFSEYSMRGISYTQRKPSIQASGILAHSSGLYIGVWASNVDINGLGSRTENDLIAGYNWKISDEVNIDLGYIQYTYPKSSILNAREIYGVLTAYGFKVGTYYSDDYYGDQAFIYNYVGYGTKSLPYDIGLDLRFGVADYKDPTFFSSDGKFRNSYHEWEVKLTKNWVGLDWSASYIDTNLSETECFSNIGDKESCSARLMVGVSKAF
ncbi:hypothetical protein J3P89_15920 [Pseudomonas sp. Z1-14]|uniref:TorF family putative porin n=1 Tax=Pseudomonas sp. Z1-14 TaxID=2817409 RepID=UPI003DA91792